MTNKELERLIELKVSECLNKVLITDYIAKVMKESLQEVLVNQVSSLIKEEVSKMARTQNNNGVSPNLPTRPSSNDDFLREIVRNGAAASRALLSTKSPAQTKRIEENKSNVTNGLFNGVDVFADIDEEELAKVKE